MDETPKNPPIPPDTNAPGETASPSDLDDGSFIPILADSFVSGSKSAFDVFVRLSSGRYLKLLQAGDNFTPDRIENYLKKGVVHFYIRKEDEEPYRKYSETIASAVLKSPAIATEVKIAQTFRQGQEISDFLKQQGVTEENLNHASKFVGNVRELVQQLAANPGGTHILDGFLANVSAAEHGVGTAMLAGILSHVVEIRMERPVQIVGMAALFHDIGLSQMPESFMAEDESQMTEADQALYRTHPKVGADLLRQSKSFEPAALQAIEQHHMRLHGVSGFPEKTATTNMAKVSEIIGICGEYNRLILSIKAGAQIEILPYLEQKVFPGFSKQIVYAFRTAFFPKKSVE